MTSTSHRLAHKSKAFMWLTVVCVIMISSNGRPAISAVGPVLEELQHTLNMSPTLAGVLTSLPGFCFGLFGVISPAISRKLGLHETLTLAMTLLLIGALGRTFMPNPVLFLLLTFIGLVGIAAANVLLPAFIYQHFPRKIHRMTLTYTVFMLGVAAMSSALVAPLAEIMPGGWRGSLGIWGALAFGAVVPLSILTLKTRANTQHEKTQATHLQATNAQPPQNQTTHNQASQNQAPQTHDTPNTHSETTPAKSSASPSETTQKYRFWANPKAIALALFFGIQSMHAYTQFGWIAQIFRDAGMGATQAGTMLATIQLINVPGGIIAPLLVSKMKHPQRLSVFLALLLIPGYLGIMLLPLHGEILWVIMLALSGCCFPIALMLLATRVDTSAATAELSGFVQGLGYTIAGIGPLVVGAIHTHTGNWTTPLWCLIATVPIFAFCGWYATLPGQIHEERAKIDA